MIPKQTVKEIYIDVSKQLTNSSDQWKEFVTLSGRLENQPFPNLLLIYYQNKEATEVATAQEWYAKGCTLKKEGTGITIFEKRNGAYQANLLYDKKDVDVGEYSKKNLFLTNEYDKVTLEKMYENTFNKKLQESQLDTAMIELIDYGVSFYIEKDPSDIIKRNINLIEDSILYSLGSELPSLKQPINEENIERITSIQMGSELNTIGMVITNVSQSLLIHLTEIKKELMDREVKKNEHKQQDTILEQQQRRSTDRGLRKNSKQLSRGKSADTTHNLDDGRRIDGISSQHSRKFGRTGNTDDKRSTEEVSLSNRSQYLTKGETPQSDFESSEGSRDQRNDNQSTNRIENDEERTDDIKSQFSLSSLSDKRKTSDFILEIFESTIRVGSNFVDGKYRINEFFLRDVNKKERINFLKKEYGIGGYSSPNNLSVHYDGKGIKIDFSDNQSKLFLWEQVEHSLLAMIKEGNYLSDIEKKEYTERFLPEFRKNNKIEKNVPNREKDEKKLTPTEQTTFSLFDFYYEEQLEKPKMEVKNEKNKNYYLDQSQNEQYSNKKRNKYQDNVSAIKLVNQLEIDQQQATKEEQNVLSKYSGWGGLQEVFDERNDSWKKEFIELKEILSEKEYEDARSSVLTAFYTPNKIIKEMYRALEMIGDYSNKTILDAGMGTGNFFMNLPENLQNMSKIGVEIDPITSKIAKQLFPNEQIYATGFEKVKLKEKVDVVIGNIPFNDITVRDKKYDSYHFRIHDYFMAKSIDLLKEKGIMMVISSNSSLDKKNSKAREYLAKRADLIGAVRLPKTAFKQVAGTEVISDILIFQKKSLKEMTQLSELPTWINSIEHPQYHSLFMNNYFVDNPKQILGEISIKNFHGQTLDILPNSNELLEEQLSKIFEKMLGNSSYGQTKENKRERIVEKKIIPVSAKPITIPEDSRKYTFLAIDNSVIYHRLDGDFDVIPDGKKKNRIKKMIPVKEQLNNVIEMQQKKYKDEEFQQALVTLNQVYDSFVSNYGYFNSKDNMRDLRMDDQYPLLLSVEKEQDGSYVKQDIFFKATIRPSLEIQSVDSAEKALQLSLAKTSKVDLEFMQSLYQSKDKDSILVELGNVIYLNPQKVQSLGYYQAWESADEYLTGEVKDKLKVAKLAFDREEIVDRKERYKQNIIGLEKAQPEPLQAGDIDFQIGSTWIPEKYYNDFVYELLEVPKIRQGNGLSSVRVEFSKFDSSYKIQGYYRNSTSVLETKTYGTSRKNAFELIENSLNLKKASVFDKVLDPETEKEKRVLNAEETMLAREKQEEIESVFHEWLFSDESRRITLVDEYNDKFNTIVPRKYNGNSLVFDDMNLQMELRPHQKDVVARILYSGKALMAHEVGAGKTGAMLSAGMYLKQNKLINKPLYVVPNHLTEQWAKEILTFYPSANVLITTKKDFEKDNRKAFVSKIATGDYDAIIIGHSQFERIPLSQERQEANLRKQLSDTLQYVREAKEQDGKSFTVKQLEKYRKGLKNKLETLKNEDKKDELLTFEQLGVDFLFVDEAHAYKNLFVYTKMSNVAGVGKSTSQRATDMFDKVRYIQEKHDGKNVVFATGTPISNSMSELYVMQHFLQPEELQKRGLINFDAWASTFGQVVSSLEITPEASGYRIRDRFKKFHNLPELMNTFNLVADIQTSDMLNLPIPKLKTEKVQTIVAEKSPFQDEMMESFVDRAEKIRSGSVDPHIDNMLKLTHEAKLMAIDSRLIDDTQPRDPRSKISLCCERVASIWEKTSENRSTQMIFSDAGTPKKDTFNVYDEIKMQLTQKGIPIEEIAFIHDAKTDKQREDLFGKMKTGEVRVLLGSTQKLGTGTNVQHKLIAAHHIDCPWKPSDLTQREGRILRQGNENEEVEIFRYITKGTFDSYLWQIQEQKLTYISQVMTGKSISRSCEDLDETVLSASEVKAVATENPLLAEKMTIDNEVTRLQLLRSKWESQRSRLDTDIRITYPNKLAKLSSDLSSFEIDSNKLSKNLSESFSITINGKIYTERKEAFEEIHAFYQLSSVNSFGKGEVSVGTYRGLEVKIVRSEFTQDKLVLSGEKNYETVFTPDTKTGNITRLTELPKRVEELKNRTKESILDTEKQIIRATQEVEKPYAKQDELNEKVKIQRELTKQIELDTMKKEPKKVKQMEASI